MNTKKLLGMFFAIIVLLTSCMYRPFELWKEKASVQKIQIVEMYNDEETVLMETDLEILEQLETLETSHIHPPDEVGNGFIIKVVYDDESYELISQTDIDYVGADGHIIVHKHKSFKSDEFKSLMDSYLSEIGREYSAGIEYLRENGYISE